MGCQFAVNGSWQAQATGSTTGSALAAPTSAHFLSLNGTGSFGAGQLTTVKIYNAGTSNASPSTVKIVTAGDSLIRSNVTYTQTPSHIWTASEIRAGTHPEIYDQALGGDTCTGQTTLIASNPYNGSSAIKAYITQCGVNEISAGTSAATIISDYQANVTAAKAAFPSAKIICGAITPAYQYWVANFGSTTANTNETTRQTVNTAIMGGAGSITGCDVRENGYLAGLTDGDGKSLLAACDVGTGISAADGLHYTGCRATVVAPVYRADLIALGL
jgi:hypothetical protein